MVCVIYIIDSSRDDPNYRYYYNDDVQSELDGI